MPRVGRIQCAVRHPFGRHPEPLRKHVPCHLFAVGRGPATGQGGSREDGQQNQQQAKPLIPWDNDGKGVPLVQSDREWIEVNLRSNCNNGAIGVTSRNVVCLIIKCRVRSYVFCVEPSCDRAFNGTQPF